MTRRSIAAALAGAFAIVTPALAQNDPITLAQLSTLAGGYAPEWALNYPDLNPEDHFAVGIEVFEAPVNLQIGASIVPVTLQLFVREAMVGAFRVEAAVPDPALAVGPQPLYDAAVADLLASAIGPSAQVDVGKESAAWTFGEGGAVEVTRGGEQTGLLITALTSGMAASYDEFWRNFIMPEAAPAAPVAAAAGS